MILLEIDSCRSVVSSSRSEGNRSHIKRILITKQVTRHTDLIYSLDIFSMIEQSGSLREFFFHFCAYGHEVRLDLRPSHRGFFSHVKRAASH